MATVATTTPILILATTTPNYNNDSYAYDDPGYDGYSGSVVSSGADPSYCAQRYKSYDPMSGTYLGRDGLRHPCPCKQKESGSKPLFFMLDTFTFILAARSVQPTKPG